jgi:hypothetical protein
MKVVGSLLFFMSLLAFASPALCQQPADNASGNKAPLQRYVTGEIGAISAGSTTMTLATEYGETVSRHSQAYVNLSYLDNVMTQTMEDNLVAAGQTLTLVTGTPYTFSGRDRGIAFTGGGKFVAGSSVRPYIGAGGGVLNIHRKIDELSIGDVSNVFAQTGLGDGVVNADNTTAIKPLVEVVGGVAFLAGKAYIDVNYRYRRAFHTPTTLDFSQVAVGIGAKW